ncbi:hypothetical protein LTR62_004583 [Meristemomyces frigidus]|uniref:Zn(2)-C6 fungal-type domain-containing protein n=1 Tax=Meristemomyces frigidus TaxID=1508187 RepID=A0AAN7TFF9_9PEZI|nr:hypothetical protein LTR62_004583 [Meristemomyces frigidus]
MELNFHDIGKLRAADMGWSGTEDLWPPGQVIDEEGIDGREIPSTPNLSPTITLTAPGSSTELATEETDRIHTQIDLVDEQRLAKGLQDTKMSSYYTTAALAMHAPWMPTAEADTVAETEQAESGRAASARHSSEEGTYTDLEVDLYEESAPKYELRPQCRGAHINFTSTWIDQDDTENYDPKEEARLMKAQRKRVKLRHQSEPSSLTESENVSPVSRSRATELKVCIQLYTAVARLALRSILAEPPSYDASKPVDFSVGYKLRSKTAASADSSDLLTTRHAERGLPEDPTGHPVARGCWSCLELNINCPLLDYEHAWPCHTCAVDGNECELIIPPVKKRACEGCKRRKKHCSYVDWGDFGKPCVECFYEGFDCVAGPAKDSIRTRIRYPGLKEPEESTDLAEIAKKPAAPRKPPVPKTHWNCLQCLEAGRDCSFGSKKHGDECTACEMREEVCGPVESTAKPPSARREPQGKVPPCNRKAEVGDYKPQEPDKTLNEFGVKSDDIEAMDWTGHAEAPALLPSKSLPTISKHQPRPRPRARQSPPTQAKAILALPTPSNGEIIIITTKFCHPILFNNTTIDADGINCNFCTGTAFPLLGLEPKRVSVLDSQEGRGYTELSGGHAAQGKPSTRMCIPCTMDRCTIISCEAHQLRGIPNADARLREAGQAFEGLFEDKLRNGDRWCSVCPSLASHECTTLSADAFGKSCLGCGLLLCETCRVSLEMTEGNLEAMLGGLEDGMSEERPLGLRADVEFLRFGGLLMRFVLWSSSRS